MGADTLQPRSVMYVCARMRVCVTSTRVQHVRVKCQRVVCAMIRRAHTVGVWGPYRWVSKENVFSSETSLINKPSKFFSRTTFRNELEKRCGTIRCIDRSFFFGFVRITHEIKINLVQFFKIRKYFGRSRFISTFLDKFCIIITPVSKFIIR